ncbi:MAG TPA: hypothetical protein VKL99_16880 [Candidatus Angelobacter sp.]|nr:hypothetical protein [Candidatus Angelobacter sp.]
MHRNFGIMIPAIHHADGETRFNPEAPKPIPSGDTLIALGETAQLAKLENLAASADSART